MKKNAVLAVTSLLLLVVTNVTANDFEIVANYSRDFQAGTSPKALLTIPDSYKPLQTNHYSRYTVSAFKVNKPAFYSIQNSILSLPQNAKTPVDVLIHVDQCQPVLHKVCTTGKTVDFDVTIGHLRPGDTIYVAVGCSKNNESQNFNFDYSIARQNKPGLNEQIEAALSSGQKSLRLLPGRYYQPGGKLVPQLSGVNNFEIIGDQVTIIMRKVGSAFKMTECQNISISGLTIDFDPLGFSQGVIKKIDSSAKTVDIEVDDYYPVENWTAPDRIGVHDPKTGLLKHGSRMLKAKRAERVNANTWRLYVHKLSEVARPGDLLTCRIAQSNGAFRLHRCENITVDSVTLYTSGAFGFHETECSQNVYKNLKVVPGPKNILAKRKRLRSTAADGFHSRMAKIGPKVYNSTFQSCGDDGLAVNGFWGFVLEKSSANNLMVALFSNIHQAGDNLRIGQFKENKIADRKIMAIKYEKLTRNEINAKLNTLAPELVQKKIPFIAYITYSGKPIELKAKDLVMNIDRNGFGFEFSNNKIHNTLSRAMCIKANGIIANNKITHTINPGIIVYSTVAGSRKESGFITDLVIKNNIIYDCGFWAADDNVIRRTGGICVLSEAKQWGSNWHHNLNITDNVFKNIFRGPCIILTNVTNAVIRNNTFSNSHLNPGSGGTRLDVNQGSIISLNRVNNVIIDNNKLQNIGPYADKKNPIATTNNSQNVKANTAFK